MNPAGGDPASGPHKVPHGGLYGDGGADPTGDLAIDLSGVTKTYAGKVRALEGVSMRVRRGEIFGLLGPNGAGKSTLVKIMTTIVRPTTAQGTILGAPVGHRATLARVGYLPEHHRFPQYLTGRQCVEFFGAMSLMRRAERKARAAEMLEVVGMAAWADRRVGTYSKGMQQRTGLAAALVNDPELVILDEPTDGVDPVGRREIRDVLIRMRDEGRTVFLNSHLLGEVEMVSDRVAIMLKGRVEASGSMAELTQDSRAWRVTVEGAGPAWVAEFGVASVEGSRTHIDFKGDGNASAGGELARLQSLIDRLRAEGFAITGVRETRESLEDLFMRMVRDVDGRARAVGAGNISAGNAVAPSAPKEVR
jgi:ABC-2 type transport system ATP-binding protein